MASCDGRIPVLYLAPGVDVGGSDKGTLNWFRWIDRNRFRPSLITTQPWPNRRLAEAARYAEEVWDLPELMPGNAFARFILTFVHTRGVELVHIMNSRLGFELLPDLAHLPERPRVVIQLQVEEPDRSGYVGYVTTRYGNLVDAFSVSSRWLSDALEAYDVPNAKRRVIRTGVDAEREFSPLRVSPIDALDRDRLQILSPVRLTAQKDPLLIVEVASELRDRGVAFQLNVLGEGELEDPLRRRIAGAGLEQLVRMHGTRVDVARWYAACDVLLLTSEFEGIPYAIYEAMAMAKPVVAPALPGIREVVSTDTGILVESSDGAHGYASALAALAGDPERRAQMGTIARAVVRSEFSLERMAAEHEGLYDELLQYDHVPAREANVTSGRHPRQREAAVQYGRAVPPNPRMRSRRPAATPLVSVIVPCYNHGRFLPACLDSIAAQTYDPIETIVVDDGSTDPETLDALADAEASGVVKLIRIHPNRGPSAARNAAVEVAKGRYVLPVDADNMLLKDAVALLVAQLSTAGERVGFVFPNYQFFGNRQEYFEPPSYNLHALATANYCDTSSLIDREVFDRGFRYPEEIVMGMEDWDFVLKLGEHGIFGEPARAGTLLYRKHGFNRNDLIEAGNVPFAHIVAQRHPHLYWAWTKACWSPAVSLVALDPHGTPSAETLRGLIAGVSAQTCDDFELIVSTTEEVFPTALGSRLRRISSAVCGSRAQTLAHAVKIARGRYLLATYGSTVALLADRTLIEKALRVLEADPHLDALALAEAGPTLAPFRLLTQADVGSAQLGALCWQPISSAAPPPPLELPGGHPLEALARWLTAHHTVQWRHVPRRDRRAVAGAGAGPPAPLGERRHARPRDAGVRAWTPPALPELRPGVADRVQHMQVWMPPQTRVLCRHIHHHSGRFHFSQGRPPPPDCSLHHRLGAVRALPVVGTKSLALRDDQFTLGENLALDTPGLLGFIEQAPLPLFDPLFLARHRDTGQRVVVSGASDPLAGMVDDLVHIGFIEPYPIHPQRMPHAEVSYGLVGLLRALDLRRRRHLYAVGRVPEGRLAGELGALLTEPLGECQPVWIDAAGRLSTADERRPVVRPSLRQAISWTGAPLTWPGFSSGRPKTQAFAWRAFDSVRILMSKPAVSSRASGAPAGYLPRSPQGRTVPLYAGVHPVTGDQLLCTTQVEARSFGYERVELLGHLVARAPVTGSLGIDLGIGVPWAAKFGMVLAQE